MGADFTSYSESEIAEIICQQAQRLLFNVDSEAAMLLAGYCNGAPGEARVLVKRVRDYLGDLRNGDLVTMDVAKEALASFRYISAK